MVAKKAFNKDAAGRALLKVVSKGKNLMLRDARNAIDEEEALRLLAGGADLTLKDKDGVTALGYACLYGQETVAMALITAGSDVDARDRSGSTPLIRACFWGTEQTIHALLDAGANVTAKDSSGCDAYYYAYDRGRSAGLLKKIQKLWQKQVAQAGRSVKEEREKAARAEDSRVLDLLKKKRGAKAVFKRP